MTPELTNLIAASTAFVGTHFALSHPLRAPLARATGEKAFPALYSLFALATFGWMVMAFRAVGNEGSLLWYGGSDVTWAVATIVMLIASVLLVGSFIGNPAMPAPGAATLATKAPHGVFHVTRHPMMWSFALWAVVHVLVNPSPRVVVLSLAIAVLSLAGSHMQDRKKEVLMGAAWQGWAARTSYWPRLGALTEAGMVPWLGGIALWLAASWAHGWLGVIPAGVWRWL